MSHANSPELLKRLRRAEGHLAAVVSMVAEGRDGSTSPSSFRPSSRRSRRASSSRFLITLTTT